LACLAVALLVFNRAYQWNQTMQAVDKALQPQWSPPSSPKANKPVFMENDSYCWITDARQMIETRQWRIRYTYADNVPYGREVHWSQSVMWLLVAFGYVRHLVTGESMVVAMETAAIWVNPFLLVVFTIGFSWLIARRMGVAAGVFFTLVFVSLPDIDWAFHVFHLGHRGLELAVSLGTVICLVFSGLGYVAKDEPAFPEGGSPENLTFFRPLALVNIGTARKHFAAAGVFTGLGLWIGATVQFFTIGALAVGSVTLACFMPASLTDERTDYVPELWRVWGIWASTVGMIFYLAEYFPSHMAMRLEVNNPFYVLSVFCVGELMVQLTRWRSRGWNVGFAGIVTMILLVAGIGLVPALVLLGPSQWHNLRDVQMARLHSFVFELSTYLNYNPDAPLSSWFLKYYGFLPFALPGALALAGPRRTSLYEWAGLWVSFFLCLFSALLVLWQVRWAGLHAAMSVWLAIMVGHIAWRNVLDSPAAKRRTGIAVLLSSLVLVQAAMFTVGQFTSIDDIRQGRIVSREWIKALMVKHLAEGMRAESGSRPLRVICDPDMGPGLYYFGGIRSVTTFYWENVQGVHDATAFFADRGNAVAKEIAKERGLTHVIISREDERWAAIFNYIKTGNRSVADAESTLLARLSPNRCELPPWITVDQNLSRIGQREFSLTTPQGTASLQSQMTIYHLEP
jgi:hypothetical protein